MLPSTAGENAIAQKSRRDHVVQEAQTAASLYAFDSDGLRLRVGASQVCLNEPRMQSVAFLTATAAASQQRNGSCTCSMRLVARASPNPSGLRTPHFTLAHSVARRLCVSHHPPPRQRSLDDEGTFSLSSFSTAAEFPVWRMWFVIPQKPVFFAMFEPCFSSVL